MEWRDYIDESHVSVEAYKAWLLSLPLKDLEEVQEAVEALRQLAAAGEIEEGEKDDLLGDTSVDPRIFALKWRFFGRHIRQYHAEPEQLDQLLVALHVHTKPVNTRAPAVWDEVKRKQGFEMSFARLRYVAGFHSQWTR